MEKVEVILLHKLREPRKWRKLIEFTRKALAKPETRKDTTRYKADTFDFYASGLESLVCFKENLRKEKHLPVPEGYKGEESGGEDPHGLGQLCLPQGGDDEYEGLGAGDTPILSAALLPKPEPHRAAQINLSI